MSEPNALLMRRPQESSAMRRPSSERLYHFDRRKRAPGKKAASTKPSRNRVRKAPVKLWVVPAGMYLKIKAANEARQVLTCQARYNAPEYHRSREIYRRLSDIVQKHISGMSVRTRRCGSFACLRRYLHQDITNIKDA
jgi:hypothetical protein